MEEVAVPGVVNGEEQAEDAAGVASAAGDVVSEGGQVGRAAVDVGGGGPAGVESIGGREAGDGGEEKQHGDEGDGDEAEQPFFHGHNPGTAAKGHRQDGGRGSKGHRGIQARFPFSIVLGLFSSERRATK